MGAKVFLEEWCRELVDKNTIGDCATGWEAVGFSSFLWKAVVGGVENEGRCLGVLERLVVTDDGGGQIEILLCTN